jgi:cytochrome c oxidase accessory protein FixG
MSNSDIDPPRLYAAREPIFPRRVHGWFRNLKWIIMAVTLAIYYVTPWIRWDRGPAMPDQAVLIDLANRRFYFFWIEIWPHEFYFVAGLLVMAGLGLFLFTSALGRVWCGYACPQTVWTDLFLLTERWVEGDRNARLRLWNASWDLRKLRLRLTKWTIWLLIALATGGAWIFYFTDAPTLLGNLLIGQAHPVAYITMGILTATTFVFGGFAREQICVYACPWPRIQAALTDEDALNVTYRYDRGEPRGSLKQSRKRVDEGLPAGDCIDCYQCVHACPTGVDIRNGTQLGCIQCGLCIDACDTVMDKIGKPHGLIAYDTDDNIKRRMAGEETVVRMVRPRTVIYAAIIVLVGAIMAYALAMRQHEGMSVLHDRNPIYVELSDGGVRNGYTIRMLNKRLSAREFALSVEGMPEGTRVEVVGISEHVDGAPIITVGVDTTRELRVLVFSPGDAQLDKSTPIVFRLRDMASGDTATASDFFKAP